MKKETNITAFKAFNADMTCRDFKYEIGKTYEHTGDISVCNSGFHACEYPLDIFAYYPPSGARFATVDQYGEIEKEEDKNASSKITIKAEIQLSELIDAAVSYVFRHAKKSATGYGGAASATGFGGAVMGSNGCALFLCERRIDGKIINVWAGIAGRNGIKSGVWYTLKNGIPVEVIR